MLDYKYKTILSVAVPLMISSFIQSIVLITDASFLSRFDTLAFDAAGNGGLLYVTMLVSLTGMSDGSQILIARRIGQENENAVGRIFGTSLFTLSFFAILLFVLLQTSYSLFSSTLFKTPRFSKCAT
jgi:multidrug resistance protein, MATE family